LMEAIAMAIEGAGVPVVVVGLDAAVADDAAHEARVRAALADVAGGAIIGGFSLGARIAAKLCPEVAPRGLLCFAYPFHAAGDPRTRHGLETLSRVQVPTRIIQGTRDNHGTEAEVRSYRLPDPVEMVWLRDANHRFVPRGRSGLTHEGQIEAAAASAISFIRGR